MNVSVKTYEAKFAAAYAALNYQWIEHYFAIEAEDRHALDDPEAYVIDKGGEIFFVLEDDEVVGTVAMVPVAQAGGGVRQSAEKVFELAKMAVNPSCQGRGYGAMLMQQCIEFARQQGAAEVMLVTNDIFDQALGLYLKSGFVKSSVYQDSRYARGNLEMRLRL